MDDEPVELSSEMVAYYRDVLVIHASHGGACPVCGVRRCRDWTNAFDVLAAAHQVMTDPARWEGPLPLSVRQMEQLGTGTDDGGDRGRPHSLLRPL